MVDRTLVCRVGHDEDWKINPSGSACTLTATRDPGTRNSFCTSLAGCTVSSTPTFAQRSSDAPPHDWSHQEPRMRYIYPGGVP